MANRRFQQFYNTLHTKPVQLDCSFIVTPTNGAGITNLVGAGIQNVFMHTSTTPVSGSPNPAAGLIYVQLQDNYNYLYAQDYAILSPVTGSAINISGTSVLTVGNVYVIQSVGTSTAANWNSVGLPVGITPAVGVPFIASVTGGGTGTGTVKAVGTSGVGSIEIVGSPNLTINSAYPIISGIQCGSYLILQCLSPTSSTSTVPVLTAPATGTQIYLKLLFSSSSVIVKGD